MCLAEQSQDVSESHAYVGWDMGLVQHKTPQVPCEEEDVMGEEVGRGGDALWADKQLRAPHSYAGTSMLWFYTNTNEITLSIFFCTFFFFFFLCYSKSWPFLHASVSSWPGSLP